jgi:hypothetical protein
MEVENQECQDPLWAVAPLMMMMMMMTVKDHGYTYKFYLNHHFL